MITKNNFELYAQSKRELIIPKLISNIENIFDKSFYQVSNRLDYLKTPYVDAFRGGKYLRSVLVCLGYEIFAEKFDENILMPSVAYEIFQTSILFHDDLIDKGDYRRGRETIHKSLGSFYRNRKNKDATHKGNSIAICMGDYGLVLTTNLILSSNFKDELKVRGLTRFTKDLNDTVLGEILDIELSSLTTLENVTSDEIIKLSYYKTSKYTVSGPLALGGIFAGADERELEQLTNIGDKIGIAFQIQDDIMGIFNEKTNKTLNSDILEGKMTVLFYYTYKNIDEKNKNLLLDLYGNQNITHKEVEIIKDMFIKSGALSYAENLIEKYCNEARAEINSLNISSTSKELINSFISYIIKREL